MKDILEFDIKRLKEKMSALGFIVIFEVIYFIIIPFAVVINTNNGYIISIIMSTILVAILIFILTICIEDYKHILIYDKLKYHPMKTIDFYISKLTILSIFATFQAILTTICFTLGYLMVFEIISFKVVLSSLAITFITILISSFMSIIFCGKSLYTVALVFIPAPLIIVSLDSILNIFHL